jgi:hypothetical protein
MATFPKSLFLHANRESLRSSKDTFTECNSRFEIVMCPRNYVELRQNFAPDYAEGVETIQPRVARNELPWVRFQKRPNPERVAAMSWESPQM